MSTAKKNNPIELVSFLLYFLSTFFFMWGIYSIYKRYANEEGIALFICYFVMILSRFLYLQEQRKNNEEMVNSLHNKIDKLTEEIRELKKS